MTDSRPRPSEELRRIAVEEAASVGCFSHHGQDDVLITRIGRLESDKLGVDWTNAIPETLLAVWSELPVDAQLAAFIVATHMMAGPNWMDFDGWQ